MGSLGERIEVLRRRRGITQEDLAIAAGMSQAAISRIESGRVKTLKSDTLAGLARALDVSVPYLIGDGSESNPKEIVTLDRAAEYLVRVLELLTPQARSDLLTHATTLHLNVDPERAKELILNFQRDLNNASFAALFTEYGEQQVRKAGANPPPAYESLETAKERKTE
jgi:transcriptional regulator with XRE-family HTH domain